MASCQRLRLSFRKTAPCNSTPASVVSKFLRLIAVRFVSFTERRHQLSLRDTDLLSCHPESTWSRRQATFDEMWWLLFAATLAGTLCSTRTTTSSFDGRQPYRSSPTTSPPLAFVLGGTRLIAIHSRARSTYRHSRCAGRLWPGIGHGRI